MRKLTAQDGSAHVVLIILLIVVVLGGVGFVAWKNLSRHTTAARSTATVHTYPTYTLTSPARVADVESIKYVEIDQSSPVKDTLIAHYDNGSTATIATVDGPLDPRALSIDEGKLYFIVNDTGHNTFSADYIDLNDTAKGATELTNFSRYYSETSQFCPVNGTCSAYATQILVDGDYLYHKQFSNTDGSSRLIRYNLKTGEPLSILDATNIPWYDYRIDLANRKVFYGGGGTMLHLVNLDGSGDTVLDADYYGTGFLTDYLYDGSLVFGTSYTPDSSGGIGERNFSTFDYTKNTFTAIKKTDATFPDSNYVFYVRR